MEENYKSGGNNSSCKSGDFHHGDTEAVGERLRPGLNRSSNKGVAFLPQRTMRTPFDALRLLRAGGGNFKPRGKPFVIPDTIAPSPSFRKSPPGARLSGIQHCRFAVRGLIIKAGLRIGVRSDERGQT